MNKLELFQEAAEVVQQRGYAAEVREGYSGRGMLGNRVLAIVTDAPGVLLGFILKDLGASYSQLPVRIDNMGKDFIHY